MILIPVIDANDQLAEADLDGGAYYVGLSWNQEGGFWTLSVRDLAGEVLTSGIPLVADWPLLHQVRRPGHPPGEFAVWLKDGATLDRGAFLRGEAALFYLMAEDL